MVADVTPCGYRIDKKRINQMVAEVEAMNNAPELENINQLLQSISQTTITNSWTKLLEHKLLEQEMTWESKEEHKAAFNHVKQLRQSTWLDSFWFF